MRNILGYTLPEFSRNDLSKLHKGLDFSGLNHYANFYIQECMSSTCEPIAGTLRAEGFIKQRTEKDGIPIGDLVTLKGADVRGCFVWFILNNFVWSMGTLNGLGFTTLIVSLQRVIGNLAQSAPILPY
ncbi:Beta-glucosidase 47 [Abeliophyllum distichum]|uniref:Beta-glucosidase 47 n=1 Tax=Abeliophyllum distichum TaxID=126358 RepID=A0ABD1QJ41_9LAMI